MRIIPNYVNYRVSIDSKNKGLEKFLFAKFFCSSYVVVIALTRGVRSDYYTITHRIVQIIISSANCKKLLDRFKHDVSLEERVQGLKLTFLIHQTSERFQIYRAEVVLSDDKRPSRDSSSRKTLDAEPRNRDHNFQGADNDQSPWERSRFRRSKRQLCLRRLLSRETFRFLVSRSVGPRVPIVAEIELGFVGFLFFFFFCFFFTPVRETMVPRRPPVMQTRSHLLPPVVRDVSQQRRELLRKNGLGRVQRFDSLTLRIER